MKVPVIVSSHHHPFFKYFFLYNCTCNCLHSPCSKVALKERLRRGLSGDTRSLAMTEVPCKLIVVLNGSDGVILGTNEGRATNDLSPSLIYFYSEVAPNA